ncbi:unnamed protein product [Schistocephalus solidus]|uniref:C2H2-type domain-containing protein n=1 Tax=Schistocephalus solidus TaxID=70667 RepID=A0A183T772_SCHSO|nr:unnamed protein product [Schistocephalus solidus]
MSHFSLGNKSKPANIPVKTGAAIYETNRIVTAKAKRAARKYMHLRPHTGNTKPPPTCPSCQRTFYTRIGLVGHLQTRCDNNPTTRPAASGNAPIAIPEPDPTTASISTAATSAHPPNIPLPALSTLTTSMVHVTTPATMAITTFTYPTSSSPLPTVEITHDAP